MAVFNEWIELNGERYPARLTKQRLYVDLPDLVMEYATPLDGIKLVKENMDSPDFYRCKISQRGSLRSRRLARRLNFSAFIPHDGSIKASPKVLERIAAVAEAIAYYTDYRQSLKLSRLAISRKKAVISTLKRELVAAALAGKDDEIIELAKTLRTQMEIPQAHHLTGQEALEQTKLTARLKSYRAAIGAGPAPEEERKKT